MAREAQYYPIWFTTDFEALGALDGWGAKIVRMTNTTQDSKSI